MNLDLEWLQSHIGAMATEISMMKGNFNTLKQAYDVLQIENAKLKDELDDLRTAAKQLDNVSKLAAE